MLNFFNEINYFLIYLSVKYSSDVVDSRGSSFESESNIQGQSFDDEDDDNLDSKRKSVEEDEDERYLGTRSSDEEKKQQARQKKASKIAEANKPNGNTRTPLEIYPAQPPLRDIPLIPRVREKKKYPHHSHTIKVSAQSPIFST